MGEHPKQAGKNQAFFNPNTIGMREKITSFKVIQSVTRPREKRSA